MKNEDSVDQRSDLDVHYAQKLLVLSPVRKELIKLKERNECLALIVDRGENACNLP